MQSPSGPTPSRPGGPAVPPEDVPGYRDLVRIGHGGYSLVYRAVQEAFGRPVALKVLLVASDADASRRFLREVELTSRLTGHPHVVTVLDAGTTGSGRPYLATDLYERGSLKDRLRGHGPLPAAEVAALGAKMADALAAAHDVGVLHRDVKPNNILVSRFGEPALADFGVACVLDGVASETMLDSFSPYYAAPEVVGRGAPSPASDVYALGATLYEALTGRPPFGRPEEDVAAVLWQIVNAPVPTIDCPTLPALATAVTRALAKDPAGRYPSAAAFGRALRALIPPATEVPGPVPAGVAGGAAATGPGAAIGSRHGGEAGFDGASGTAGPGSHLAGSGTGSASAASVPAIAAPTHHQTPLLEPAYATYTSQLYPRRDPVMTMLRPDGAAPAGPRAETPKTRRWSVPAALALGVAAAVALAAALSWPASGTVGHVTAQNVGAPGSAASSAGTGRTDVPNGAPMPGALSDDAQPGATTGGPVPAANVAGTPVNGSTAGHGTSAATAAPSGTAPASTQPSPAPSSAPSSAPAGGTDSQPHPPTSAPQPSTTPPPPPRTTPPVSTSCSGWSYQNNSAGYGVMAGAFHLESGPYQACSDVGTAPQGAKLYYWCYVVNAYDNKWIYGRLSGTNTAGWMSAANLTGSTGPLNHC